VAQDSQVALRVLLWGCAAGAIAWFVWKHQTVIGRRFARD
jgi:hypothetical protein